MHTHPRSSRLAKPTSSHFTSDYGWHWRIIQNSRLCVDLVLCSVCRNHKNYRILINTVSSSSSVRVSVCAVRVASTRRVLVSSRVCISYSYNVSQLRSDILHTTMATYSRKRSALFEFDHTYGLLPLLPPSINGPKHVSKRPQTKKPRLTQMTIDLGGCTQKTCKACGMEYVPSNPEDAKVHKKYHDARVGGIDMPRTLAGEVRVVGKCARCKPRVRSSRRAREESEADDVIVEIGRRDTLAARNAAFRVLEVAEEELGAVRTLEDELWSLALLKGTEDCVRGGSQAHTTALAQDDLKSGEIVAVKERHEPRKQDRYKFYLYLQNNKCLGLCLSERIQHARPVEGCASIEDANITLSEEWFPADMGISRIWVTSEFRRASIAQRLLDAASRSFLPSQALTKERVAFSQPTASGARLARDWFEKESGWLVYGGESNYHNFS